jgi:FAD/FMN-containing dehydrogenase
MDEVVAGQNFMRERLEDILGPKYVSTTPSALVAYASQAHSNIFLGKERLSEIVVLPSTTAEVQNIITFAQRNRIPVVIFSSAVFTYWSISKHGGIIIDMKRMNRILSIDDDNCLATAEAGCSLQRFTAELLKKKLFLNQGGAPSSCLVASRYTFGNVNKATGRIGWEYRSLVGWEMVLPDGTILRNGSRANAYETEAFWAHGPGPDLWLLPRYAMGQFGAVTEVTIRCHTLDDVIKSMWVSFNDIEDAQKAYIEFAHAEICTGSCLYSNFKTAGYAADTTESAYRITRMFPEIHMILTLQGTPRRVAWEEKRVREIAEKHNGRIITDKFPPFQVAFDSQLSMAASIYSEYTVKYFTTIGSSGPGTALSVGSLEDIETVYKFVKRLNVEQEWQGDPNKGFYGDTCAPGLIVYPGEAGHYVLIECMGPGIDQPDLAKAHRSLNPAILKFRVETGIHSEMHGGSTVPGRRDYGIWPTYVELITKFHETLDPNNVMNPGSLFPPMLR